MEDLEYESTETDFPVPDILALPMEQLAGHKVRVLVPLKAGSALKNPPKKTHPKKPKKTHLKKPTKNVFCGFFWVFLGGFFGFFWVGFFGWVF